MRAGPRLGNGGKGPGGGALGAFRLALRHRPPRKRGSDAASPGKVLDLCADLPSHEWMWIAVVCTRRSLWRSTAELYVDGRLRHGPTRFAYPDASALRPANAQVGGFPGQMASVALFDRPLSAKEVARTTFWRGGGRVALPSLVPPRPRAATDGAATPAI